MFENIGKFFRKMGKPEPKEIDASYKDSKEMAKERLHMVLMQDRANVSADFLELMKQEIIDVIKKYIEVDEEKIDVRLTTNTNDDGSIGTPSLYANIPILNIRNDMKVENYKFALQNDGSIIAQKIEEPKEIEQKTDLDTDDINNQENENLNDNNINENISNLNEENDISKIEAVEQENIYKIDDNKSENIMEQDIIEENKSENIANEKSLDVNEADIEINENNENIKNNEEISKENLESVRQNEIIKEIQKINLRYYNRKCDLYI